MKLISILNEVIEDEFTHKLIKESLIKLIQIESINLNLSKQFRKIQSKQDVTLILDDIFGKNVYRLYYDLETGKQIFNKYKTPKLKFDIQITDKLKNDIETILNKLGYSLVDLEKNEAKKITTNQPIKITKVIRDTDISIVKQYNEYLGGLTKKYLGDEKMYVVISRHSHDIASMSSKPNITSCEDLSDYVDIKDTHIGIDDFGEGSGVTIMEAIKSGKLVFYLIREGDFNIQDPISRYLEGNICDFGNSYNFYGKFHVGFKEFINNWISYYHKIKGVYNVRSDKDFFSKNTEEIEKILFSIRDNETEYNNVFRGLVIHERYDVIYNLMCKSESKWVDGHRIENKTFDMELAKYVIEKLISIFGYKILNGLPNKIKDPIFNTVNESLKYVLNKSKDLYEILYMDFEKTRLGKDFKKNPSLKEFIDKNILIKNMKNYSVSRTPYDKLGKFVNNDIYNKIKEYQLKISKITDIDTKINDFYNKLFIK
jgi:hypothetical protein